MTVYIHTSGLQSTEPWTITSLPLGMGTGERTVGDLHRRVMLVVDNEVFVYLLQGEYADISWNRKDGRIEWKYKKDTE